MSIKLKLKCDLVVYWNSQVVRCYGQLIYHMFSQTNTITVFDYSKYIGQNWNFGLYLAGSWKFNVYIPFAYPISFAGLNFQITANYNVFTKVVITNTFGLPYQVKVSN